MQILFQKEHTAFLKFVSGITDRADQEWYASVMLNRLMFVYFIQRKGFLDGARDYLRNRLSQMREERGKDKFYLLLPLLPSPTLSRGAGEQGTKRRP